MSKSSFPKLSFLCFGVGAIGTYIGGSLSLIGQKVAFVERPAIADEVKKQGLRLRLKDKDIAYPTLSWFYRRRSPQARSLRVAIFAIKSYDTRRPWKA